MNKMTLQLPHSYKKIRFICYKYFINSSSFKFKVSSFFTFLTYIFSEFISLKYNNIFSF